MDRDALAAELARRYGGSEAARKAVARQAGDLADAGRLEDDLGADLDVEMVCTNMADAPEGHSLVERWNWWMGALELSHGGYERFRVRPDIE